MVRPVDGASLARQTLIHCKLMAFFAMSEITSKDARFEVKFVASAYHLADILCWLRFHGGLFVSQHANRRIHNIYFDTYDLIAYRDNVSGIGRRNKVRYRWYGEEDTPTPGVLDLGRGRRRTADARSLRPGAGGGWTAPGRR